MYMNRLLHNVIWPAVAGNILWAFLQVLVKGWNGGNPSYFPNLSALFLVGVYLAIDWVDTEKTSDINDCYWKFDLPLATALALFAICTQDGVWWSKYALVAAFVVIVLGHLYGAWDLKTKASSSISRATLASFNALGIVLLIAGSFVTAPYSLWLTPVSIFVVVALFLTSRQKVAFL